MIQVHFDPYNYNLEDNQSKEQSSTFKSQIKNFVDELDAKSIKIMPIESIYPILNVKRRRLYDVINVLNAIGCSTRSGTDQLIWNGKKQIINELQSLKKINKIDNWNLSLDELFPTNDCVSLSSLTISFLLLFPALDCNIIDLKIACFYFSRNTTRYKTTLCKLYQIILILSALDIVSKTQNACQIRLLSPYLECLIGDKKNTGPDSIEFLLNRTYNKKNIQIQSRRNQFYYPFIKEKNDSRDQE